MSETRLSGIDSDEYYDIALVLDDAPIWLREAGFVLQRVREKYAGGQLLMLDILYGPPGTLLCLLYFDRRRFIPELARTLAVEVRAQHFRVLDLMHLTQDERTRFFGDYSTRFEERYLDVKDIDKVLHSIEERLVFSSTATASKAIAKANIEIPVSFPHEGRVRSGVVRQITSQGGFVACDVQPATGAALELSIGPGNACYLAQGRVLPPVLDAAESGFAFDLDLSLDEATQFEAFLIAASRGQPWPGESGRMFERFVLAIPIRVTDGAGVESLATTINLSRGGLFVATQDFRPIGSELRLYIGEASGRVKLDTVGVVKHVRTQAAVAAFGGVAGMGIQFLESPGWMVEQVRLLLEVASHGGAKRAMVVDDDRFFRVVFGHDLRRAGFQVLEAASGDEAFGMMLAELLDLDLLVVDYYMPGMSGGELVDKVCRVGRDDKLGIAVLTGASLSEEEKARLLSLGADVVMPKDAGPVAVLSELERVRQRP